MVSLCLTKPHIDKTVTNAVVYGKKDRNESTIKPIGLRQADSTVTSKKARQKSKYGANYAPSIQPVTQVNSRQSFKSDYSERSLNDITSDVYENQYRKVGVQKSKKVPSSQSSKFNFIHSREEAFAKQRQKMIDTLQAMGSRQGKRLSSRKRKRHPRLYTQNMPDARKDAYRVHKWRIKSGRNVDLDTFSEKTLLHLQRKLNSVNKLDKKLAQSNKVSSLHYQNIESRYLSNAAPPSTMIQGKEELFGFPNFAKQQPKRGRRLKQATSHLPSLRNYTQLTESFPTDWDDASEETIRKLSTVYSRQLATKANSDFKASLRENQQVNGLANTVQPRRYSEVAIPVDKAVLPPIVTQGRRRSLPERRSKEINFRFSNKSQYKRKVSLNPNSSPVTIPENEILHPVTISRRTSKKDLLLKHLESSDQEFIDHKVIYSGSPIRKKSHSPMTIHAVEILRSSSKEGKDGDTPTDSEGSFGGSKYRKTRKARGSRILTKMESRSSPQAFRYIKPARMDALMRLWYICARLTIWLARLFKAHRVVVDDSYNIHNGSTAVEEELGNGIKKEVLFDVTDYKMKNQLRLSETTRRVLLTQSEKRTDKDLNLVQTALRNIKAISDYSNTVQKQIGKYGYFVGFEGKRVVVKENKRPLNYYLLLAGSAVVIKSDESGNTNPVLFMKRGEIFGEKEILDDTNWQWSVVTSGFCEFLLLDREDYKNIFITGGGGGLLSDPDRGGFLRSIELLKRWPIEILEDNPNRCLFRYFKRGAVLVNDSSKCDWIFVIKSGSCSVLKQLEVEKLTNGEALFRLKKEQKFKSKFSDNPRLVEKIDEINEEEHVNLLLEKAEKEQAKEVSVYQQLEMSSILKELNPYLIGTTISPRADAGFDDRRSEFPFSSYRADVENDRTKIKLIKEQRDVQEETFEREPDQGSNEDNFRLSRHSDRHPPRTPSPTKAAYLRTGISTRSAKRNASTSGDAEPTKSTNQPPEIIVTDTQQGEETHKKLISSQKQVYINEFLFGADSPLGVTEEHGISDNFRPVHINVRKLTKSDVFGIESDLYANQPSLALVSNGAECLMLNKKFFLENATEEGMKLLRETGYPYPSNAELEEQHWRLMAWKAYQAEVVKHIFDEKSD